MATNTGTKRKRKNRRGQKMNRRINLFMAMVALFCSTAKEAAGQPLTVTPANPNIAVGQTQQFTTPDVSSPADVAAGDYHVCVLLQSGEVRCAGNNSAGQLGDGTQTDSSSPVAVLQLTQ